jgi:hypothetical protein
MHALQGNGEIAGHTADVSGTVTLQVEVVKGLGMDGPVLFPVEEDLPHLARPLTDAERARALALARAHGMDAIEESLPISVIGTGPDLNAATDNGLARAGELLGMTVPEVANRATVSGAIEIGRHPGVVRVTFRAPVDRLAACGLLGYAEEQYGPTPSAGRPTGGAAEGGAAGGATSRRAPPPTGRCPRAPDGFRRRRARRRLPARGGRRALDLRPRAGGRRRRAAGHRPRRRPRRRARDELADGLPAAPAPARGGRARLARGGPGHRARRPGIVHARMRVAGADGTESALDAAVRAAPGPELRSATVRGTAAPERELSVPLHRERLRGNALLRQVETWVRLGVAEPSVAEAVGAVVANPDWLDLSDRTVVVLGAGAEMGPLQGPAALGRDRGRGRPAAAGAVAARPGDGQAGRRHARGPRRATARATRAPRPRAPDLLEELPAIAAWLAAIDGPLVLGDYVYADGATNVRVCVAVDALRQELRRRRDDLALAFLATPTDVFAVPDDAVAHSARAYAGRSRLGRLAGGPCARCPAGGCCAATTSPARAGDQRQPRPPAGPELRAGQAAAALAGGGGEGTPGCSCRSTSPRRRARAPW